MAASKPGSFGGFPFPEWLMGPYVLDCDIDSEDDDVVTAQPASTSTRRARCPPTSAAATVPAATLPLAGQELSDPETDPDDSPWRPRREARLDEAGSMKLNAMSRKIVAACKRPASASAWARLREPLPLGMSRLSEPLRQLVTVPEERCTIYSRTRSRTGSLPVREESKRS